MSEPKILEDGEYILKDGCGWFEVENISIRIRKTDECVYVDLYGKGCEDADECIVTTYAYFDEVQSSEDLYEEARR